MITVLGRKRGRPDRGRHVSPGRRLIATADIPTRSSSARREADAERRDFTINGMFYDPLEDRVIDFVGGQDDLARGILRAIGEPRARFDEDKLRLLRAVRFAASFDFVLDPPTRDAIEAMASQVTLVSVERIAAEMRLMLVHASRVRAVLLLREMGLLDAILPELAVDKDGSALNAAGRPIDEAWVDTLEVLTTLVEPSFPLALAALLHALVDPACGEQICRRLEAVEPRHPAHALVADPAERTGRRATMPPGRSCNDC